MSFVLRACVGVVCFVGDVVWFRTCTLVPAPACGFAAHTEVGPRFDTTSPANSKIRFASHQTGNMAGKTKVKVNTIRISLLRDVGPTAKKMYISDQINFIFIIAKSTYLAINRFQSQDLDIRLLILKLEIGFL